MERLYEYMQRQLARTPDTFMRYRYSQINWENPMLGLVGPRGVGKTTLFLQHILNERSLDDTLFVSADHMYFADHTLYDTAEALYRAGKHFFYIDEVHKYENWSRELKAMYDTLPGLHVYFTGSSVLDIEKGEADLSRRAPKYLMQGLSFREYLAIRHGIHTPVRTLEQILAHDYRIGGVDHPLPYFKDYLHFGYYPFGTDSDFEVELDQVITRTLEVDIPQFANMNAATGRKLKRLMAIISSIAPFKPNLSQLASRIGASRNNVEDYLLFMEKAGMIAQLRTERSGLGALGKIEKVYLDNTNILSNLSEGPENIGTVRETFFYNQMHVNHMVTASKQADFEVGNLTFEIGGRTKGGDQLKDAAQGYIVKDDIEYGYGTVIPLWAFGLNY